MLFTDLVEEAVAGNLLGQGEDKSQSVGRLVNAEITEEHFPSPAGKAIFAAAVELARRGVVVDCVNIQTQLQEQGKLEVAGGSAAMVAPDNACVDGSLDHYIELLKDNRAQAAFAETLHSWTKELDRGSRISIEAAARQLAQLEAKHSSCQFAVLDNRRFDESSPPPKPEPVLSLAGVPISTSGNLTNMQAKIKAGKSAALTAAIASLLGEDDARDYLGFSGCGNKAGLAVVHFDTEQSFYDHHRMVQRTLARAGLEKRPEWFRSYCATGLGCEEVRRLWFLELQRAAEQHGGLLAAFADGPGDMVKDVNDPAESFDLVKELQRAAMRYACPIVTVLHENPARDTAKMRGHLGSHLERKAETPLRLEKADGITTIWTECARHAGIAKEDGPRFHWDNTRGMHLSHYETRREEGQHRKEQELQEMAAEVYRHASDAGGIQHSELLKLVGDYIERARRSRPCMSTCKNKVRAMIASGYIYKTSNGLSLLSG